MSDGCRARPGVTCSNPLPGHTVHWGYHPVAKRNPATGVTTPLVMWNEQGLTFGEWLRSKESSEATPKAGPETVGG